MYIPFKIFVLSRAMNVKHKGWSCSFYWQTNVFASSKAEGSSSVFCTSAFRLHARLNLSAERSTGPARSSQPDLYKFRSISTSGIGESRLAMLIPPCLSAFSVRLLALLPMGSPTASWLLLTSKRYYYYFKGRANLVGDLLMHRQ